MGAGRTTETFVRPPEVAREAWSIPARHFNRCRLFLSRSDTGCVFIPIRTMQYMAVVDAEEMVFVDSHGGYVRHGDEAGRPILISWQFLPGAARTSLTERVPCQVVYYREGLADVQRRLVSELGPALDRLEKRHRNGTVPPRGGQVIRLPRG